jgi:sulfur-oxidizing protein SoxZ
MSTIKVRAKAQGDLVTVKCLIKHPMETGQRTDTKTGEKVPAHFIQEVHCAHQGNNVLTAAWGPSVSQNPYLSFIFSGGKAGDSLTVSWTDNKGESDSLETTIS